MRWSWCHITAIFRIKPFLVHPCSLDTPSAYFLHGRTCKKEINPGSMFILLVFVPLCFMVIRFVIIPSWYRLAFTYIKAVGVSDGDLWNLFRSSHTYKNIDIVLLEWSQTLQSLLSEHYLTIQWVSNFHERTPTLHTVRVAFEPHSLTSYLFPFLFYIEEVCVLSSSTSALSFPCSLS